MAIEQSVDHGTLEATIERNMCLEEDLVGNPAKHRMLTGDRPTGRLHVGHLFGSVLNRVRLHRLGVPTFIVIADYQVLTDRETCRNIAENVRQVTIDYIAAGIHPDDGKTFIFPHSQVPELNQLLVPFLTLVTNAELSRNPTVKEEIQASGLKRINAGMYTYPVHQAADILFCRATVVPVGKDQLPHVEITRTIARRFNDRYAPDRPVFPEPQALLSNAPTILGLDGSQKMSKSRNNAIVLSATEDETAEAVKRAQTDSQRAITYDPVNRPEVSNLVLLLALAGGSEPLEVAQRIGDGGAAMLKVHLTEALNEYLRPFRKRRRELEQDMGYVRGVLRAGTEAARGEARRTLDDVIEVMDMRV